MIRENKWKAAVSSLVILLPVLAGLILWNRLPETMETHWGLDGSADGFSGKKFAIFGIPVILLIFHWIALFAASADSRNKDQSRKVVGMFFWIMPVMSIFSSIIVLSAAFGRTINMMFAVPVTFGLMFIIVGNYLPKTKRNYTMGIKLPWTMANDENWNRTHRIGGKIWFIGGIVILFSAFLPVKWIMIVTIVVVAISIIVPAGYSYCYYKKQKKDGRYEKSELEKSVYNSVFMKVSLAITAAVLIVIGVIMFTGNIEVHYGDSSFEIEASYWKDLEIKYDDIESIEYREGVPKGIRTDGFGSPRLSIGEFENDEFGRYIRYTYTKCDSYVVIKAKGETLVLNDSRDGDSSKEIYEKLLEKTDKK